MEKRFLDNIKRDRVTFFIAVTETNHLLSELEKKILSQFFVENFAIEQCMEWHKLSESEIEGIYHVALNKLNRGINILNENFKEYKVLEAGYLLVRNNITGLTGKMDELKGIIDTIQNKKGVKVISTLEIKELLCQKIASLPISQRTKNIAKAYELNTLEELLLTGKSVLLTFRNFGKGSITEIELLLAEYGIKWTKTGIEH